MKHGPQNIENLLRIRRGIFYNRSFCGKERIGPRRPIICKQRNVFCSVLFDVEHIALDFFILTRKRERNIMDVRVALIFM